MRRFDRRINLQKANLLSEQRYIEAKSLLNEMISGVKKTDEELNMLVNDLVSKAIDGLDIYLLSKKTASILDSETKNKFYFLLAN
jgi:hypothetical protein